MDVMHSCRCCLRRPPDRDLMTPYAHSGKTEIYSDILKECFDLYLTVSGDVSCGICSACVGRLRDASDFKLQVQRSQAELQAWLQEALRVKEEEPAEEAAPEDADGSSEELVSGEQPAVKPEMPDEDGTDEMLGSDMAGGDGTSDDEPVSQVSNRHKRVHTGVKYTCDECNKQFTQKRSLSKHKRIHSEQNPYSCDICHKKCTQKSDLDVHKRIHTGEKPYSCDECKKKFTQKCDLKNHKRVHSGEKPYKCEECNYTFSRKSHLETHKKIHSGEKPHKCAECNKRFTQKSSFDRHKRVHSGKRTAVTNATRNLEAKTMQACSVQPNVSDEVI